MTENGKQTRKQTTKAIQQLYTLFASQMKRDKGTIGMIGELARLMVSLADDVYKDRDDERAQAMKNHFRHLNEMLERINKTVNGVFL